MKKNCTPFLSGAFLLVFSIAASAQNTAISTDGSAANYVVMPQNVIPDFSNFTVELWAYIPSYATGQHYFMSQGDFGTGFYIGYDGNNSTHPILAGESWVTAGAAGATGSTGITMPINQWVHIAVICNSGTQVGYLYVNGILAAQTTNPATTPYYLSSTNNPLEFGLQFSPGNTPPVYINGKMDQVRIWKTLRTGPQLRSGMYGTVDPATAGLLAYYSMNDVVTGNTVKNNSTSVDSWGSAADGTWSGTPNWVASPIQSASNALTFGGGVTTFPQVNINGKPSYDLSSGGTVELWVYPASLSSTNKSTLISNHGSGATRYIFQATDSKIYLDNGTSSTSISFTLPLTTWSHLAFVYDGASTTTVYYNNVVAPIGTLSLAYGSASTQPLAVGVTNNSPSADTDPFLGALDEVRIWTSQQTQAAIAANIIAPLTGTEPGLAGLFTFDQGDPGKDNTGLTTVLDNTPNYNDASLAHFALTTASASNYTGHTLVPLPVNFTAFTAIAQKNQSLLQWQTAQEQNSRDFVIERSVDGMSYSAIGSVGAAGNSSSPSNYSFVDAAPVNGRNYYRLKETDLDNKFMYSDVRIVNFAATADDPKLVWFQTGDQAVEVDLKPGNNEAYTVTDISGRTIRQGQLSSGRLSISQVPGGMYFVKVISITGKQLNTPVIVK